MEYIDIGSRRLTISDREVIKAIGDVECVNFVLTKNNDNTTSLVAYKGDGYKVYRGKRGNISINVPSPLKPFSGRRVVTYIEHLENSSDELFRIDPKNFKFDGKKFKAMYGGKIPLV